MAPTARCNSSRPRSAQAVVCRRAALSATNGSPNLTVSTIASRRVSRRCARGAEPIPTTMMSRPP